jgi:hypothetical protein
MTATGKRFKGEVLGNGNPRLTATVLSEMHL